MERLNEALTGNKKITLNEDTQDSFTPKNNKENTNIIIALPNVVLIKPNISVIILGILDGIIKVKTMNVIKKQEYNSNI